MRCDCWCWELSVADFLKGWYNIEFLLFFGCLFVLVVFVGLVFRFRVGFDFWSVTFGGLLGVCGCLVYRFCFEVLRVVLFGPGCGVGLA